MAARVRPSLTTPVPQGPYRAVSEGTGVVLPWKTAARSGIPPGENVERKTVAGEEFHILPGNRGKCRTVRARRAFRSAFCPETGGNVERKVPEGEEFDIFPGLGGPPWCRGARRVGAPGALRLSSLTTTVLRGPCRVRRPGSIPPPRARPIHETRRHPRWGDAAQSSLGGRRAILAGGTRRNPRWGTDPAPEGGEGGWPTGPKPWKGGEA